jgi:hypothetical protein
MVLSLNQLLKKVEQNYLKPLFRKVMCSEEQNYLKPLFRKVMCSEEQK